MNWLLDYYKRQKNIRKHQKKYQESQKNPEKQDWKGFQSPRQRRIDIGYNGFKNYHGDENLTRIWQDTDENLTRIWQESDKNLTRIWREFAAINDIDDTNFHWSTFKQFWRCQRQQQNMLRICWDCWESAENLLRLCWDSAENLLLWRTYTRSLS